MPSEQENDVGAIEQGGKVAAGTVEALKSQPLALALVVVNVLFLAVGAYVMHAVAARHEAEAERRVAFLHNLLKDCRPAFQPDKP